MRDSSDEEEATPDNKSSTEDRSGKSDRSEKSERRKSSSGIHGGRTSNHRDAIVNTMSDSPPSAASSAASPPPPASGSTPPSVDLSMFVPSTLKKALSRNNSRSKDRGTEEGR